MNRLAPAALLALVLAAPPAEAKSTEEWLRQDLRAALSHADLVLVAEIESASDLRVSRGGKTVRLVQEVVSPARVVPNHCAGEPTSGWTRIGFVRATGF